MARKLRHLPRHIYCQSILLFKHFHVHLLPHVLLTQIKSQNQNFPLTAVGNSVRLLTGIPRSPVISFICVAAMLAIVGAFQTNNF